MIWVSHITFTLSTLLAVTWGYPSASGWQDNSISSSSGWTDNSIPSSLGWKDSSSPSSFGWKDNSVPSSSGWTDNSTPSSLGWKDSSSPSSSGWKDNSVPSSSGWTDNSTPSSSGWKDSSSPSSSGSSGWQSGSTSFNDGSAHNFYDTTVSTDYVSRYHGPIALPVVLPDGTIADTPEVAAAKAAHLAALEKAKALWYGPKDDGSYDPHKYEEHDDHGSSAHGGSSDLHDDHSYSSIHSSTHGPSNMPYSGPLATTAVLPSGYLADTPAIQAARAAHLTALHKAELEAEKWKAQGWKQWK